MVIADTSVWIQFFNRPESPEKRAIDVLIDADELILVGIVLAELLQGCRTQTERDTLKDALLALSYLEVAQSTWMKAGDISSTLLRKGVTLPMSDLLLAATALEHGCDVYSLDAHFTKIPGLSHHTPAATS